ncbi:hypothetical protein OROMI_014296 [Orobanche minor]
MDYEPYDSSGTDDDFPRPGPPHQNRMSRGGRISGNGRPAAMGSMPYPMMYDGTDMEAKIHQLEQEAYSSILRAFKAQADAISWDKETLMTTLRKELRVSNEEHKDYLSRVNADETIRIISEWRQSLELQPGMHSASRAVHEAGANTSVSASRKKQKIASSLPSQSYGGPSPSLQRLTMTASAQPSSSAAKHGSVMGPKGKKHKSIPPGATSMRMQYASGPAGRGRFSNCVSSGGIAAESAEGGSSDPLIGRKIRMKWPEDNTFYEAVITMYNPVEGRHAIVYDMEPGNETWEWINLSEVPPQDIQWEGEDPGIYHRGRYGGPGQGMNRPLGRDNASGAGRGRGLTKGRPRKDFPPSQNGIGNKGPDDIQLLHTDTLIKEVERVYSASHPDPVEIEKAKKVLKEHGQALSDAIAMLGDLSDGESEKAVVFYMRKQWTDNNEAGHRSFEHCH